ncbi:hypothetical protein DFP74_5472 [Nocardiopsis sp. Huas11]|nr:hypothetical protein DFP74_5472 [Nocardiopsis sp. Huas11]
MTHTIARFWAMLTRPLPGPQGRHHRRGTPPPLARRTPHSTHQRHSVDALTRVSRTQHQPGEFDELAALTRYYLAMREER